MSRIHEMAISQRCRRGLLAGAAAIALVPVPASAFFQQTKLEGTVGSDIGGVWLSVQNIMPEFRITFPKPATAAPPFTVGPIPAELEPLTGKKSVGVVISACPDERFCSDNGLLVGDVVVKINSVDAPTPETFNGVFQNPPNIILLSVRRPALKMTTARLFKIKYTNQAKASAETSEAQESVDLKVLDVRLVPFGFKDEKLGETDRFDETRRKHVLFEPEAAQLEELGKTWSTLPVNSPMLLIKGEHRFVAKASFDEGLASDPVLSDSRHAIVLNMEGNPLQGRGGKIIDIYGIETVEPKLMEGSYVTATLASAPFPINIEFKGRFRMIRVADWSDADDKRRAEEAAKKPKEDLDKFKTLPDVPPKPETE